MDRTDGKGYTRKQVVGGAGAGVAALGAAQVLAACGGGGSTPGGTSATSGGEAEGKPIRGGKMTVGWVTGGQAETINPAVAVTNGDIFRSAQLFDGLFTIGPDQRPKPALAESAEPDATATVWTVTLRPGITWHDGKPLTADDVVAAVKSWTTTANYAYPLMRPLIATDRVKARGKNVVEIGLKKPVAELPSVMSFYQLLITRSDSFDGGGAIGTGPFKYRSFKPGGQAVFAANQDYWGQKGGPYVDELVVDCSFPEDNSRVNALLSGAIDVAPNLPFALAKQNESSGQIRISSARGASNYSFTARIDLPPFKDPKVIQALKLLVDQEQMIESVFSGYASTTIQTPMGNGLPNFAEDLPVGTYDPEKAKSLLKAAGQENLKLTLNTSPLYPGFVEGATLYADQAKAGGVDISITNVNTSLYYTEQGPEGGYLSYPFFTGYPGGGSSIPSLTNYWLTCLWKEAPYNESHFFGTSAQNKLMFDAIGDLNEASAADKWRELQQIQIETGGYLAYANFEYVDGYGNNVKGIEATPAGWANNFEVFPAWLES